MSGPAIKISIITVCYNAEATIGQTLRSILGQTYPKKEIIVIDGASTDSTINQIKPFKNSLDIFISEKDGGPYHAMNKGIKLATGDIIGFLHSNDLFYDEKVLEDIGTVFMEREVDSLHGDLLYVRPDNPGRVIRYWKSTVCSPNRFLWGWMPPHPTFYVQRNVYQKYGLFNADLALAADYEIMLRFLCRYRISNYYLPRILIRMRAGGISNRSLKNRIKAHGEDRRSWRLNGLTPYPFTMFLKPLSKVGQYLLKAPDNSTDF